MAYSFNAVHLFTEGDDYMITLGFADDEFEPSKFVILQQSYEYDDQDKKLGMDKIHIQVEDQFRSLYGGIKSVHVNKAEGKIYISLDALAKTNLKIDGDIEVFFKNDHQKIEAITTTLAQMLEKDGIECVIN